MSSVDRIVQKSVFIVLDDKSGSRVILPGNSVPQCITGLFDEVKQPSDPTDLYPIDIDTDGDTTYYSTKPDQYDLLIGFISKDIGVAGLCRLINSMRVTVDKHHISILKEYVNSIDEEPGMWLNLSSKMDYSYFKLKTRMWPVNCGNNQTWQDLANKIGLRPTVYPGRLMPQAAAVPRETGTPNPENPGESTESEISDLLTLLDGKGKFVAGAESRMGLHLSSNYGAYHIPGMHECDHTSEDVVCVFNTLLKIEQYGDAIMYICRLLVSRKSFHLVVKDPRMMDNVRILLKKYPSAEELIMYCMSYSFAMLLKEERIHGKHIRHDNRSIMDEDEFRSLPIFTEELDTSPYMTEIYHHYAQKNLKEALPMHLGGERRFLDRSTFLKRLSIMAGGMLDGICLKDYGAFLTGSSLPPCVVTNPLEKNFGDGGDFSTFVDTFYPGYDHDPIYGENLWKCMDAMKVHMPDNYQKDPSLLIADAERILDMSTDAAECLGDLKEALLCMDIYEGTITDLDIAVSATSLSEYDENVQKMVDGIRKNLPSAQMYLHKKTINSGYKWILKGRDIKRPIDFFKVWVPAHTLLYRFHMNIVRFWWDGDRLRGLASAVCAALTGVNQWYRWFSNNKDPMSIVLKNMRRGYTTLLNYGEITAMRKYIGEVDQYKHIEGKFLMGRIHRKHTIFMGVSNSIDDPQYWPDPRTSSSLITNRRGRRDAPKTYLFQPIIDGII